MVFIKIFPRGFGGREPSPPSLPTPGHGNLGPFLVLKKSLHLSFDIKVVMRRRGQGNKYFFLKYCTKHWRDRYNTCTFNAASGGKERGGGGGGVCSKVENGRTKQATCSLRSPCTKSIQTWLKKEGVDWILGRRVLASIY